MYGHIASLCRRKLWASSGVHDTGGSSRVSRVTTALPVTVRILTRAQFLDIMSGNHISAETSCSEEGTGNLESSTHQFKRILKTKSKDKHRQATS